MHTERYLNTIRYVTAPSLPPGPSTPRALQTLRWIARPTAMLEDCHRRYGDMFTMRLAQEGDWVFLAHPDAVKQVFTGDPRLLHAGEANVILLPVLGSNSVLLLDEAAHMSQRKLLLPPFHGERMRSYAEIDARGRRREAVERWPRGRAVRRLAEHAGDHARGDHAHRLRGRGRDAPRAAARRGRRRRCTAASARGSWAW